MENLFPSPDAQSRPPVTAYLTMDDLRMAHEALAEIFANDSEPLPSWESGDLNRLEECRACIEVEAFGVRKYPDLPSAAAKLFYATVKAHSFPNGNKRFALVLTFLLLIRNGYLLKAPKFAGAEIAKWVAETNPHDPSTAPDLVVAAIARFYNDNMGPAEEVMATEEEWQPPEPD